MPQWQVGGDALNVLETTAQINAIAMYLFFFFFTLYYASSVI
jgi:hypothetical protein